MTEADRNIYLQDIPVPAEQVLPAEIVWDKPLAVMVYAGGTRAVIVSEDEVGDFKLEDVDLSPRQAFSEIDGRVKRLDEFGKLTVHHVPISPASFTHEDSITGESTVYLHFSSENTVGEDNYIPGEDLFDLLSGQKGGLLTFEGQRRPPEAALVFKNSAEESEADILFFHTNEVETNLDSDDGMSLFFKSLADEIAKLVTEREGADINLVRYIKEFEEAIKTGKIPYQSNGALQIYRAIMMAHVRLFDLNQDEADKKYLQSQFSVKWWVNRNAKPDVAGVVKNIFFKEPYIEFTPEPEPDPSMDVGTMYETLHRLKSERAKNLRVGVRDHFGLVDKVMARYFTEIFAMINSASGTPDLHDATVLLDEVNNSFFSRKSIHFKVGTKYVQIGEHEEDIDGSWYSEEGSVADLIKALEEKLERRREELDLENFGE